MGLRMLVTLTIGTLGCVVAIVLVSALFAAPRYRGRLTDHFDGTRFINQGPFELPDLGGMFRWRFRSEHEEWPVYVEFPTPPAVKARVTEGARLTFVNHSTVLIQVAGLNILTDPVLSERIGPIPLFGAKRHKAPGISLDGLPRIDVILISHNHYDHLDVPTLKLVVARDAPRIFVPLGNEAFLEQEGIVGGTDLDLWQSERVGTVTITLTPAQHWSSRSISDRFRTLWGAFYLRAPGVTVYFAGDTGFGPHFEQTATRLGKPDIALLPIGAYAPRWFMHAQHMAPDEAIAAHLALGAKTSIATHFGCFNLASEGMFAPIDELERARAARGLSKVNFKVLEHGEPLIWSGESQ